mmetsp:Transcript_28777/g.32901  ORF Transcript_28777/g.32901 Transcript_28777/m.32901 type:complete len:82 (-) Transcript_28777:116-361(-)
MDIQSYRSPTPAAFLDELREICPQMTRAYAQCLTQNHRRGTGPKARNQESFSLCQTEIFAMKNCFKKSIDPSSDNIRRRRR